MGRLRRARIARLLLADGEGFISRDSERLDLTFLGIAGDRHAGAWRSADARTPWHPRGTPIANTRQVSIVSREECALIAGALALDEVDPSLLGANLVVEGLPDLSHMPPATRLLFPSGAAIFVTEHNAPCRYPAEALARAKGERSIASGFVKAATGRRGLVGLVEREGAVVVGDAVRLLASPAQLSQAATAARPGVEA